MRLLFIAICYDLLLWYYCYLVTVTIYYYSLQFATIITTIITTIISTSIIILQAPETKEATTRRPTARAGSEIKPARLRVF